MCPMRAPSFLRRGSSLSAGTLRLTTSRLSPATTHSHCGETRWSPTPSWRPDDCALANRDRRVRRRRDLLRSQRRRRSARDHAHARRRRHACRVVPAGADSRGHGFRVITWDCRGFGNSTFTSGVHGSAAAVADMAAVLDATGTPGAHLVGQSMGGWWVTAFTVAHPARTHSLTLSNTVGGLWTTALLEHFRKWTTEYVANFGAEQRIGAHAAISPTFVERDPARALLYQEL